MRKGKALMDEQRGGGGGGGNSTIGWWRDESRDMLDVVNENSRTKNGSNESEKTQTNHQGNPCHHQIHYALHTQSHRQHHLLLCLQ